MKTAEQPHESLSLGPNEHLLKSPAAFATYAVMQKHEERRDEALSVAVELAGFFDVSPNEARFSANTYAEYEPKLLKDTTTSDEEGAEIWRKAQVERPGFGALIIECYLADDTVDRIWVNDKVRPVSEETITFMGRYAAEYSLIRQPYIVNHLDAKKRYATPLQHGLRQTILRMSQRRATNAYRYYPT